MTDECYWNRPLTGKDGKKENGSRKYRDYYFEKEGNITNKELADHFNVSESVIKVHKSNYQYDKVLSDKKAYEREQSRLKRDADYLKHIDEHNKNAKIALNVKYAQIEIAAMKVGIIPVTKTIPNELTFEKAWATLDKISPETLQKVIMRNFEQPAVINGTQHHTADITNINFNHELPSDAEVDELYENRFKEFITNALGENDKNIPPNNTK